VGRASGCKVTGKVRRLPYLSVGSGEADPRFRGEKKRRLGLTVSLSLLVHTQPHLTPTYPHGAACGGPLRLELLTFAWLSTPTDQLIEDFTLVPIRQELLGRQAHGDRSGGQSAVVIVTV
jgi:hypothetical protein